MNQTHKLNNVSFDKKLLLECVVNFDIVVTRGLFIEENSAERRKECPRRTTFEAAVDIVRHEQQHAKLLQGDQLHVALVPLPHLQPLEQRLWVDVRHGRESRGPTSVVINEDTSTKAFSSYRLLLQLPIF